MWRLVCWIEHDVPTGTRYQLVAVSADPSESAAWERIAERMAEAGLCMEVLG